MANFSFQGRDANGQKITGIRQAKSPDVLSAQLIKEGIIPVSIQPQSMTADTSVTKKFERMFRKRVSYIELNMFCRQMLTLYRAGIPINVALARISETTSNPTMIQALIGVIQNIESGVNLTNALKNFPDVFPQMMVSLTNIGEVSGRLDEIFLHMSEYFESEDMTSKRLKTVMRYPMIVMATVFFAIVLLGMFVLPVFAKMFAANSVALPLPTRVLLSSSEFMRLHWISVSLVFIIFVASIYFYMQSNEGKYKWSKLKLHLPILGKVIRQIVLSRFAKAFSLVSRSGIPMTESVDLVASALNNNYASKRVLLMREALEHGENLTSAAVHTKLFSPLVLQMIAVGEETGALDVMLDEVAGFYEREVDYSLKRLNDLIEPILLFALAIVVLVLALAVYLPIWDMIKIVK